MTGAIVSGFDESTANGYDVSGTNTSIVSRHFVVDVFTVPITLPIVFRLESVSGSDAFSHFRSWMMDSTHLWSQEAVQVRVPGVVRNITMFALSSDEIGLTWQAPLFNGGSAVLKYLIEWDFSAEFVHQGQSSHSVVITQPHMASLNDLIYAHIDTHSAGTCIYARVSAFNLIGYGEKLIGQAYNSTSSCIVPAHQAPYMVSMPVAAVSVIGVSNRLEISWLQPVVDQYGFSSASRALSSYEIDASPNADFNNYSSASFLMVDSVGAAEDCSVSCTRTLGIDIQNVTLSIDNYVPLNGGSFSLVYSGKYGRTIYVSMQQGSANVQVQ